MGMRWWDFGGTTVVRANEYIRLTGEHPSSAGWLFCRLPFTATNWEIEVEFKISGKGNLFGDGMAMWLTKDRAEMGSVFGMKDKFEGLAIFFDTYKNHRPGVVFPYVMAMVGDGIVSYDQANDGKANELAGCSARGLRNNNIATKAKITHFHEKQLTVELMFKNEDEWTKCFEVPNIKLPNAPYLGFSAETGELVDNHDIVSVETRNLYSPSGQNRQGGATTRRRKGKKNSGGIGFFGYLLRFLGLGVVVVGLYAGYTAYRARQRDRF